jgi:hypothetical protein
MNGRPKAVDREDDMSLKKGRMTKRNRAKHRRRAYEAGMRGTTPVSAVMAPRPEPFVDGSPPDLGGKRAA